MLRWRGLFTKYLFWIGAAITLPLLLAITIQAWLSFRETERGLAQLHEAMAQSIAIRVENFVSTIGEDLFAALRLSRSYDRKPAASRYDEEMYRLLRRHAAITELTLLDPSGKELFVRARLASDRIGSGKDWSQLPLFTQANDSTLWVEPAYFYRDSEPRTRIAVRSTEGHVLIAEVSLKLLWALSAEKQRGDESIAYVVTRTGTLIAHPDLNQVLRVMTLTELFKPVSTQGWSKTVEPVRLKALQRTDGVDVVHTRIPLASIQAFLVLEQVRRDAYRPVFDLLKSSLWVLAMGLLASLLASAVLAQRMSKPIRLLHDGATRIAEGDLEHRIVANTDDELGQLAGAFNHMANRLLEGRELLETRVTERTDDLVRQIARGESLMQELQQKKAEAELANVAKTRFLASASHDLRQPMHAIGLLVGVLKKRIGHPDAFDIVKNIQAAVEAMERLFSALLDISRLDAGIVHPNICTFPLSDVLLAVEKDLSVTADGKGLQIRVVATSVWVRSDPQVLERIVRNLVANAIRYTPRGKVLLGCRHHDSDKRQVRLEIHDTGIGIAETDISRIFMEFVQIGNAERDRSKGLGLGLSIVKRSAELLGHPLNVQSTPEKGSCFSITLPRMIEQEHKSVIANIVEEDPDLSGTFVVFIDDDKEIRTAMGALLNLWNCHCILAASADEAVEALTEHLRTPDVIVSDYWLADGKDGVGAIALLRQAMGEDIPGLIVTGDITPADLARIDSVHLSLLHKPINPQRLGEAIAQAIAGSKGTS